MRSYEDLDARNGMNRAPRSSRDLTARSFENQLMGRGGLCPDKYSYTQILGDRFLKAKISIFAYFTVTAYFQDHGLKARFWV